MLTDGGMDAAKLASEVAVVVAAPHKGSAELGLLWVLHGAQL